MKKKYMGRIAILSGVAAFLAAVALYAADDHARGGGGGRSSGNRGGSLSMRQPMMIHMNHSASGGSFRTGQPSYGQIHWNHTATVHRRSTVPVQHLQATRQLNAARVAGVRNANVVHHHAYEQGVVRQRLAKIGVKTEPSHISDRSEMVSTDRAHSTITYPRTGPGGTAIHGSPVSPRQFNNPAVRAQMGQVNRADFMAQVVLRKRKGPLLLAYRQRF